MIKSQQNLLKQEVEQYALRLINLLILSGIRMNSLRRRRSQRFSLSIRRAIKQVVTVMEAYHFCQLRKKLYPPTCCQGELHMQRKLFGIINADFDATGQLLTAYSTSVKYLRKSGNKMKQVHQLWIEFQKAHDSVRREVLYNILIEFCIATKLVRLIKMCLNETCSTVRVGKH